MKGVAALAVLLAALACAPAHAVLDPACPSPRCADYLVPLPAGVSVPDAHVRVILPQGYDSSSRAYPVLYLLHGAGDTYQAWTHNTDVLALTRALDLIIVMPDGGRNGDAGWYSDWADGSRQWETFHTSVLVDWTDATFHTLGAGHRAIAGLSMGGFGAMHDAARHPGEYAVAASFSGALDSRYLAPLTPIGYGAFHAQFGTPDNRVWGDPIAADASWAANNPTDLAAKLAGTKLLIATGNGLLGGAHEELTNPGGYFVENIVWQEARQFVASLDAAGVTHTDLFYGSGDHSWPYWRDDLAWALPQIMSVVA